MGASLNLVFFIGNITQEPILRTTPGGKSVCNFGLAVNDPYGGDPLYLECEAWEKRGEAIAKFCAKGASVHLTGKLTIKRWDDPRTGAKRSKTVIVVSDAQFLSRSTTTSGAPPSGSQESDSESAVTPSRSAAPARRTPPPPPPAPFEPTEDVPF